MKEDLCVCALRWESEREWKWKTAINKTEWWTSEERRYRVLHFLWNMVIHEMLRLSLLSSCHFIMCSYQLKRIANGDTGNVDNDDDDDDVEWIRKYGVWAMARKKTTRMWKVPAKLREEATTEAEERQNQKHKYKICWLKWREIYAVIEIILKFLVYAGQWICIYGPYTKYNNLSIIINTKAFLLPTI